MTIPAITEQNAAVMLDGAAVTATRATLRRLGGDHLPAAADQ
ncbi:MAG: hypothetical protein VW057_04835 [Rhodospirillaceae bacterium]